MKRVTITAAAAALTVSAWLGISAIYGDSGKNQDYNPSLIAANSHVEQTVAAPPKREQPSNITTPLPNTSETMSAPGRTVAEAPKPAEAPKTAEAPKPEEQPATPAKAEDTAPGESYRVAVPYRA